MARHHVLIILTLLAAAGGAPLASAQTSATARADDERRDRGDNDERKHHKRGDDWRMIGHDSTNSRNQPFEHKIGPHNAGRLALKWSQTTAGDVSATPAVVNGAVYFGDFGGMLWKLDADTGDVIWSKRVADYTGIAGDIARTSPSVLGDTLIEHDLAHASLSVGDDYVGRNERIPLPS